MIDLKPACAGMTEVLRGVADDQLGARTPCDEYTVADLIDHVDLVTRGATALALGDGGGLAGNGPEAVHLEPGWRDLLASRLESLGAAWDDPDAWEGSGNVPGSDLANRTWARIALTELVVHGWDIARATGQRVDLPDATLQACLDHVVAFVPEAPVPGLFGPAVEVTGDASLLDRIVAATGRDPGAWSAMS